MQYWYQLLTNCVQVPGKNNITKQVDMPGVGWGDQYYKYVQ